MKERLMSASVSYDNFRSMKLNINMARGKPDPQQVALADGLLHCLDAGDCILDDGTDVRNYGGLDGLTEMKQLFAEILNVQANEIIVGGNSSLNLMFDTIATFVLNGFWTRGDKFICPAPGYDRHFTMCEYFGLDMLTVPMTPSGPDMDIVEEYAKQPDVVGMWNVPVFSNPQGYIYSAETIKRLHDMHAANPCFRIFWDNAYAVHHFRGQRPNVAIIPDERSILFTSLSKVSYAGASVSCIAVSGYNRRILNKRLSAQTVGPEKVNQLRHLRYFKNLDGILRHMEKHAAIMRPKFELAEQIFSERLKDTNVSWTRPDGGYFISMDVAPGRAAKTEAACREAGLIITGAGATFPYINDPQDRNLRIAPSYLPLPELETALEIVCCSVKVADKNA
jgi:DNA-binding transcriptional MocR family regulator